MNELEELRKNWFRIHSDLSSINRVSWLAYLDSYPLKIENNILVVGILDRSKLPLASEEKHLNNLEQILLNYTKLKFTVKIQIIEDETLIRYIKDKKLFSAKKIESQDIVNNSQNKVNTQNLLVTSFLAKRWQWIIGFVLALYFVFLFLDSKFEIVPDSPNIPQQVNEFECKTYTDSNGKFVDPCGDNFVPEENPGYQGR